MRFCKEHWAKLRKEIDDRALSHLVAKDGATAAEQMRRQLTEDPKGTDPKNFDPLMSAHWAIASNVMDTLGRQLGPQAALSVMGDVCPLCHINKLHENSCTDPKCILDKKAGYDWMLGRAADDALSRTRELGLAPKAS